MDMNHDVKNSTKLYLIKNLFEINKFNCAINKIGNRYFLLLFLMITTFGYSQLAIENFETGIPSAWAVRSNLTVANNWIQSPTSGYLSSGGASVNPALNLENAVEFSPTTSLFAVAPTVNIVDNAGVISVVKLKSFIKEACPFPP